MLYTYTKDHNYRPPQPSRFLGRATAILPLFFLFVGLVLVGQVAYPIVGWYLFPLSGISKGTVSPLATNFSPTDVPTLVAPVRAVDIVSNPSYQTSSWFPAANQFKEIINSNLKTYTISIPKLKIDAGTVEIGGDDLKKSLIAWPTSATPGNYGVNIIFGHSELPQFANTKDYSGMFTHIMELADGDIIYADYDGVRYKYQVIDRQVIDPDNLSVLEQRFDDRYLTLITCVPPGTLWKRGVVKARLTQT